MDLGHLGNRLHKPQDSLRNQSPGSVTEHQQEVIQWEDHMPSIEIYHEL